MSAAVTLPASRRGALLVMIGVIAVSSASFTMIKVVLRHLSPLSLAAGRVTFSACLFTLVITLQPGRRSRIARTDRWRVLLCGAGGSAGFHVLYSWGQSRVSVAISAVVLGSMPAVVAVGEFVFLRHRLRPTQIGGLLLSLLGIAIVSTADRGSHQSSIIGIVAVAAATIVWSGVMVGWSSL